MDLVWGGLIGSSRAWFFAVLISILYKKSIGMGEVEHKMLLYILEKIKTV